MQYEKFKEIVCKAKEEKPIIFELECDKIPSKEELDIFEKETNIKLPKKYCDFLMDFGGGYFGFSNIYSIDENSIFYIGSNQDNVPNDYVAVADNGCGDYYVMDKNSECLETIYLYENDTGKLYEIADDILEFLIKFGLKKEL